MFNRMAIYCLGVSISHNGSAVLLKDGEIVAGIEKERLSRTKHDGGDETLAVRYCLDAAGITMANVNLVVQNWLRPNVRGSPRLTPRYAGDEAEMFFGADLKTLYREAKREVVQVSHHHAHAWSALGASPFDEAAVLVMDQSGNEPEPHGLGRRTTHGPRPLPPRDHLDLPHSRERAERAHQGLLARGVGTVLAAAS